jgi:uncharacterized membrane protein
MKEMPPTDPKKRPRILTSRGLAIGLSFGLMFGLLLNNLLWGMLLGVAIGIGADNTVLNESNMKIDNQK